MLTGFKRLMATALLAFFTGGVALGVWMAPKMVTGPELPAVESIFKHAEDTVVQIHDKNGKMGSGVVIDVISQAYVEGEDPKYTAYVLTADHVVRGLGVDSCIVGHWVGEGLGLYPAKVIDRAWDEVVDLALVKVENLPERWTSAVLIDPVRASELKPGQEIWLAGCPTEGLPQVTHGYIQDMGGDGWEDFMRMSASIVYGNSGGPVFLPDGRLVGIGVRLHVSAGLPVWNISKSVTPENIHGFLMSAGFGYLVNGSSR